MAAFTTYMYLEKKLSKQCSYKKIARLTLMKLTAGAAPEFDDTIPLPETEGLWYMSQSKKHQHLLKHPVIAAFLFMKWQRMGPAYNKNLLFYFVIHS